MKTIKRSLSSEIRKEDNLTPVVNEFFETQKQVKSFEFKENKIVDVEGTIHYFYEEELAFKLDNVSGDIICHCKRLHPSQIPAHLGGEIIFDIESLVGNGSTGSSTTEQEDDLDTLHALSTKVPTKEEIEKRIKSCLWDSANLNLPINIQDIIDEFNNEKTKTYTLDVDIVFKHRLKSCDISLVDNNGEKYPIKLEAGEKAMYLTYLLFEDGIRHVDTGDKFQDLFIDIYKIMPNHIDKIGGPLDGNRWKKSNWDPDYQVAPVISKIRKKITAITQNTVVINKFSIYGKPGEKYKIEAGTPEIREKIKSYFKIS